MSQQRLAAEAHVSKSLLAKVETGQKPATPGFTAAVARALGVERAELTGQPYRVNGHVAHAAISDIRQALCAYHLPLVLDVPVRSIPELRAAVAGASRLRAGTNFTRLAAALPGLLDELHAAVGSVAGSEREALFGLLAEAYYAVECLASGLGYEDLYLLAIERYEWAALRSGDPLMVAAAQWGRAGPIMRAAAYRPGLALLERARDDLEALDADAPTLAMYGSLHLRSVLLAARGGDSDTAWAHADEARDLAARVGETNHYELVFGPSNAAVHEVSAAVELGDEAKALAVGDRTRLFSRLPAERRGPYHIGLARAHLWHGQRQAALESLLTAEKISPEQTRNQPMARETTRTLIRLERHAKDSLRGLANRDRSAGLTFTLRATGSRVRETRLFAAFLVVGLPTGR